MALPPQTVARRYTYSDFEELPEDHVIRTLIDGELFVSPSPTWGHQTVLMTLTLILGGYAERTGGRAFFAPLDVYFNEKNFVQPDLLFIRADRLEQCLSDPRRVEGSPDLVVEVSSPSTRHFDLVRKRKMYQDFGITHYWFVDLESEQVLVFNLGDEGYGEPEVKSRGETVEASGLPGLSVAVQDIFGA